MQVDITNKLEAEVLKQRLGDLTFRSHIRVAVMRLAVSGVVLFGVSGCASNNTADSAVQRADRDPIVVNEPTDANAQIRRSQEEPVLWVGADAELDINDQRGDGNFVRINSVDSPYAKLFVVITNSAGEVIGVGESTPGRQLVSIPLEHPVTNTSKLNGTLYADNDDGVFSLDSDFIVLDDNNEIVSEDFDYIVLNGDRAASNDF